MGEWRYNSTIFDLDEGEWSDSRPGLCTRGEIAPGTHCTGGWMGPRAGLDAVEMLLLPGIEPLPSSPDPS
jgi:hypothetical protein